MAPQSPPHLGPPAVFSLEQWDRYQCLRLLGQGGMGEVYQARDRALGRLVALKFIRSADPHMTARFMQEARAQSRIDHPGICKVYEVGSVQGRAFIAMQFVEGAPLQHAVREMSLLEKVQTVRDAALALHAAHEMGIIHRDIKPANILIERVGRHGASVHATERFRPIIVDFGLAREAGDGKGLTESGAVLGTPSYMSPEQARGEVRHLDRRTDVYGLGATLYDLLSGAPPFEHESVVSILLKVLNDDVRPLRTMTSDIPSALDIIVCKCLNKEPQQRYQTALDLAEDLSRFLGNQRIVGKGVPLWYRIQYRARRNKPVAGLLLALALSLIGLVVYGLQTRATNARRAQEAAAQAALAQQLGQVIKEVELFMRAAYGLPTHDIRREQGVVLARMARLRKQLGETGGDAVAPAVRYALGRGYLVLRDYPQAQRELEAAWASGYRPAEARLALGLTLGERYRQELEEVRRTSDPGWVKKKERELQQQYMEPALRYLAGSESLVEAPEAVAGLIAFYSQRYDEALGQAEAAQRSAPWLAEPWVLQGDVHREQAIALKEKGEQAAATAKLGLAIAAHRRAGEIYRSDARVHEALAQDYLWWLAIKEHSGEPEGETGQEAISACERAQLSLPNVASPYQTQAMVHLRQAILTLTRGENPEALVKKSVAASQKAVALDPGSWQAHYSIGSACGLLMQAQLRESRLEEATVQQAVTSLKAAAALNPNAHWAWNDLGAVYMFRMIYGLQHGRFEKDLYEQFVTATQKSAELQPDIATPYANLSYGVAQVADFQLNSGGDPSPYVAAAIRFARQGQARNQGDRDHVNNETAGHLLAARAALVQGTSPDAELSTAQELIERSLALNQSYVETHQLAAQLWVLRAQAKWQAGQRPGTAEIAEAGLVAVAGSEAVAKEDAVLRLQKSQLQLLLGQAKDDLAALGLAAREAEEAVRLAPDSIDALVGVCEAKRQLVAAQLTAGRPGRELDSVLQAAERACDQAVERNQQRGNLWAQRGATRLLRAKLGLADARLLQTAGVADLQHAFTLNPQLRRRYAGLLTTQNP
nr:serine/threonine-protein kinase [Haliangium sp. UPWRP_2]